MDSTKNLLERIGIVKDRANLLNALFLFIWLFLFLPKSFIIRELGRIGLDASCVLSVNLAFQNNLEFGTEYLNTYGPLAFVQTGYLFGIPVYLFYGFHLFLTLITAYLFHFIIFRALNTTGEKVFGASLILFIGPFYLYHYSLLLFVYFMMLVFKYVSERKLTDVILATVISVLLFYIKLNTGLIMPFLLVITCLYLLYKKLLNFKHLFISLGVYAIMLFILGFILNTSIVDYIFGSKEIISGFNFGMYKPPMASHLMYGLFTLAGFAAIFLFNIKRIFEAEHDLFFYGISAFSIFILYKYGFVRGGAGHTLAYFSFITIYIVPFLLFTKSARNTSLAVYAPILMISIIGLNQSIKNRFMEKDFLGQRFGIPYMDSKFLDRAFNYEETYAKGIQKGRQAKKISPTILNMIGDKSVDMMGSEQSIILYNELNYNPRPVIQSYSAYTQELDLLNAEKYNSETKPDFILWDRLHSPDTRHAFWDEGQTKLAMLKNYELARAEKVHLYRKREKPLIEERIPKGEKVVGFNKQIPLGQLSNNKMLYMYADIETTFFGKLISIFYQPDVVKLELQYKDGTKSKNKVIPNIIKNGILINNKITEMNDVASLFNSLGSANVKVQSMRFVTLGSRCYKPEIKIRFEEINYTQQ